jgi:hypothetical protein
MVANGCSLGPTLIECAPIVIHCARNPCSWNQSTQSTHHRTTSTVSSNQLQDNTKAAIDHRNDSAARRIWMQRLTRRHSPTTRGGSQATAQCDPTDGTTRPLPLRAAQKTAGHAAAAKYEWRLRKGTDGHDLCTTQIGPEQNTWPTHRPLQWYQGSTTCCHAAAIVTNHALSSAPVPHNVVIPYDRLQNQAAPSVAAGV